MAGREHSRAELIAKLGRRGYSAEYVAGALDMLAAQGLQSDSRFAEQFVNQRRERGFGPLRIRDELLSRGIAADLIETTLDGHDDWQSRLEALAARQFATPGEGSDRELARQVRFLLQRGFPESMVRRLFSIHWDR